MMELHTGISGIVETRETIMFYVTSWDTGEILGEYKKLAIAKRYARGEGHTGEDIAILIGYPPIAYVANEAGECVYNPRFGKTIRADLGAVVNAQNSDSF